MSAQPPDATAFAALYDGYAIRIYSYARRHVESSLAEDVVAETFLVAWRRFADVPDEPLPWLLVVARNVIANQRRALGRRGEVFGSGEAAERLMAPTPSAADVAVDRQALLHALASLSEAEREALLLVGWDGLSTREAAGVAGCSAQAFAVRLHRARRRLTRALVTVGPVTPAVTPVLLKETS